MEQKVNRYPRYGWVVLGLACLTMITTMGGWQMLPALAYQLTPELKLGPGEFTLIFTAPVLVAIFTALPGGALGDRFGIRGTVAVAAFIAAVAGLLRAFTPTFAGLFTLMLIWGIAWGMLVPNLPKLVGVWFPPERTGLASGIYMGSMGLGATLGLLTAPLFPGWRDAFIYAGVSGFGVALLWLAFSRSSPPGVAIARPDLISGIKVGLKSRNIWLLSIIQFLIQGAIISFQGNLPQALSGVYGLNPSSAAGVSALMTLGFVTGNLFLPALSDRIGRRKPFVFVGVLLGAATLYYAWLLAPGPGIWLLSYIGGALVGGAPPVLFTLPAELREIGEAYVGGASGIIVSAMNTGGFVLSVCVTAPIMAPGTLPAYSGGFLIAMACLASVAIPALFLTETGKKKAGKGGPQ
jgi:AAHS family 3-hydroxyphenylpropionic acid transporter